MRHFYPDRRGFVCHLFGTRLNQELCSENTWYCALSYSVIGVVQALPCDPLFCRFCRCVRTTLRNLQHAVYAKHMRRGDAASHVIRRIGINFGCLSPGARWSKHFDTAVLSFRVAHMPPAMADASIGSSSANGCREEDFFEERTLTLDDGLNRHPFSKSLLYDSAEFCRATHFLLSPIRFCGALYRNESRRK